MCKEIEDLVFLFTRELQRKKTSSSISLATFPGSLSVRKMTEFVPF